MVNFYKLYSKDAEQGLGQSDLYEQTHMQC